MIKEIQRKRRSFAFQWFGTQSLGELGEFMEQLGYNKPEVIILPNGLLRIKQPKAIDTESDLEGVQITVSKNWWVITEGGNFPFALSREEFNQQFGILPVAERVLPLDNYPFSTDRSAEVGG